MSFKPLWTLVDSGLVCLTRDSILFDKLPLLTANYQSGIRGVTSSVQTTKIGREQSRYIANGTWSGAEGSSLSGHLVCCHVGRASAGFLAVCGCPDSSSCSQRGTGWRKKCYNEI